MQTTRSVGFGYEIGYVKVTGFDLVDQGTFPEYMRLTNVRASNVITSHLTANEKRRRELIKVLKYLSSSYVFPTTFQMACSSELDFHIWNADFQLFGQAKSEAKMATHEGEILCVSFSRLRGLVLQFQSFTRLQLLVLVCFGFKTFPTMGKVFQIKYCWINFA